MKMHPCRIAYSSRDLDRNCSCTCKMSQVPLQTEPSEGEISRIQIPPLCPANPDLLLYPVPWFSRQIHLMVDQWYPSLSQLSLSLRRLCSCLLLIRWGHDLRHLHDKSSCSFSSHQLILPFICRSTCTPDFCQPHTVSTSSTKRSSLPLHYYPHEPLLVALVSLLQYQFHPATRAPAP